MFANNLPYDIDNKCVYVLPINKSKRMESVKDGRPWSNIRESKRSNFSGDRYMSTCRESYDPQCPHFMQYKKINRRKFTPKSVSKSCGTLSSRSLCEACKIWEFLEDSDTVIIKHYGLHSCSPIKPKWERELTKEIVGNPQKSIAVRRNILSSLVREDADLEVIENKTEQLLDRTRLNKLRNNKTGTTKFTKLIELKQKYSKKDKFLIYRLNSRSMNSKPTYVFSSSETAVEIERQIDRDKNNYLSSTYAYFDRNEKRV